MDALDPTQSIAEATLADWRPDSPMHSPSWRWIRARWLFETNSRASPRLDDREVRRARDFLVRRARLEQAQNQDLKRPARPSPAIEAALQLACVADPLKRGELEAFLLTDKPLGEIARRFGLPTAVVASYHDLFYSVRDRPEARDWIMAKAIGCGPWNEFAGPQPVGIWKYGAFSGGPLVLELLIAVTLNRPLPDCVLGAHDDRAEERERRLRLKAGTTVGLLLSQSRARTAQLAAVRGELDRLDPRRSEQSKPSRMLKLMENFLVNFPHQDSPRQGGESLHAADQDSVRSAEAKRPGRGRGVGMVQRSLPTGGGHGTQ